MRYGDGVQIRGGIGRRRFLPSAAAGVLIRSAAGAQQGRQFLVRDGPSPLASSSFFLGALKISMNLFSFVTELIVISSYLVFTLFDVDE